MLKSVGTYFYVGQPLFLISLPLEPHNNLTELWVEYHNNVTICWSRLVYITYCESNE